MRYIRSTRRAWATWAEMVPFKSLFLFVFTAKDRETIFFLSNEMSKSYSASYLHKVSLVQLNCFVNSIRKREWSALGIHTFSMPSSSSSSLLFFFFAFRFSSFLSLLQTFTLLFCCPGLSVFLLFVLCSLVFRFTILPSSLLFCSLPLFPTITSFPKSFFLLLSLLSQIEFRE